MLGGIGEGKLQRDMQKECFAGETWNMVLLLIVAILTQ